MTLVVGRILDGDIIIESDSRITDPNRVRNDPLYGLLKTVILCPFVCLSFAGSVHFIEKALKHIFKHEYMELSELLIMLLQIHLDSEIKTDFAVASIIDNEPRLFRITDGAIEKDIASFWIGDKKGFEVYQSEYHKVSNTIPVKRRMYEAFEKVISESSLPSIGNFHITVQTDHNIYTNNPVFMYAEKAELSFSYPQEIECTGDWQIVPWGTTETGSYGISYLVTVSPTHHGVAIHFPFGRFGILFCPQINLEVIRIIDVDPLEFVAAIKERYGIPLRGLIKSGEGLQLINTM